MFVLRMLKINEKRIYEEYFFGKSCWWFVIFMFIFKRVEGEEFNFSFKFGEMSFIRIAIV